MAASAGSAPRPAPPTSEVARSLSDHTSIFSAASARIFQVGPSNSLLAVSIDSSPFTDRRHEATESKYGSRVILTFVLRIPKVKLGAGGQASERLAPRAANTHSYPSTSAPCTTATSTAAGAAGARYKKTYTCAAPRRGRHGYLPVEGGFRRGKYFCTFEAIMPRIVSIVHRNRRNLAFRKRKLC